MKIDYNVELHTGFYNNHDILSQHNLYEKTHKNSIFKSLLKIEKDYFKKEDFSTVIAFLNDIPIGFILIEHYQKPDTGSFKFQKITRNFITLGSLQMYVSPEFRGKGIASEMCRLIEEAYLLELNNNKDIFNKYILLNSVNSANTISSRVFKTIISSYTGRNNKKNESDLKSEIRFHRPSIFKEKTTVC